MIIGLTGKKHSGKSTIAKYLSEKHGYIIGSFPSPIYLMEEAFLRYQKVPEERIQYLVYGPGRDTEIVPELGWQTSRYFQQTIGTDWGRNIMHKSLWKNALISTGIFSNDNVVVENVRFLNEAHMIRDIGGCIIKIQRNDNNTDQHKSEQELTKIQEEFTIYNDSTKEQMYVRIENFIATA